MPNNYLIKWQLISSSRDMGQFNHHHVHTRNRTRRQLKRVISSIRVSDGSIFPVEASTARLNPSRSQATWNFLRVLQITNGTIPRGMYSGRLGIALLSALWDVRHSIYLKMATNFSPISMKEDKFGIWNKRVLAKNLDKSRGSSFSRALF